MSTFVPELKPVDGIADAYRVTNVPRGKRRDSVLQTARIDAKRAGAVLTERGNAVFLTTTDAALDAVKAANKVEGRGRKPRENGIAAALAAAKNADK